MLFILSKNTIFSLLKQSRRAVLRIFSLAVCWGTLLPFTAQGAAMPGPRAFAQRFTANTNGDVLVIGNTGMTCAAGAACTNAQNGSGTIGNDVTLNNNNYTMVYVDTDGDPSTFESSSATLSMPAGSTILWAGLYWGGEYGDDSANPAPRGPRTPRDTILFRTPASGYLSITAAVDYYFSDQGCGGDGSLGSGCDRYSAFADVTALVRSGGSGSYLAGNIRSSVNFSQSSAYAGWGLVVVLQNSTLPLRNLTVFDGYVQVGCGSGNSSIPVAGFLTPRTGPVNTVLGVIAGEGDLGTSADTFLLNGTQLVDPVRYNSNFFDSAISNLGVRVSAPNINPAYFNQLGWDIARVNASNILANGATNATINLGTTGDCYYPALSSFMTDLYIPVITPNVTKTGTDVNGGNLVPGDILRYTISMFNSGLDTGTNLAVIDGIPPYTNYVPGSLKILTGPAGAPTGTMTDAAGDDAAEFVPTGVVNGVSAPLVVLRLGSGANAASGGTLKLNEATSLSFDVQLAPTIPAGTILTNSAQISYNGQTLGTTFATASSAAASAVFTPPVALKSFMPPVVSSYATRSKLSIILTNPASNLGAVTGVAFNDTFPPGLVNDALANPSLSCSAGSTPGTLSGGIAGGNSIGMGGTTIAQNGSCTVTVWVKSNVAGNGNYTNTINQVTSGNAGSSDPVTPAASATFSVGLPTITKAFSAPSITTGGTATLTFTLTNPTAALFTGTRFTDSYPAGLVNAAPLTIGGTCAVRTVDAATVTGGGVFNLTGATIPINAACTVTVLVRGSTAGSYDNSTSGVTTVQTPTAGPASNSANLLVYAPLTASKSFVPLSISTNGVSRLTIIVGNGGNSAATPPVTGVAFTDSYTGGTFVNSSVPNPIVTCSAGSTPGTLTGGVVGGTTIGMTGGSIASGGSCTVSVNVTSTAAGNFSDAADPISTGNAGNGALVPVATLNVSSLTPPGTTKVFSPSAIASGLTSTMTITLSNANGSAINGVSFTDALPAGMTVTGTPASLQCGATVTVAGDLKSLTLSGGTIAANGNCTVTATVTAATANLYTNNTGLIYTGNAGVGLGASATLSVLAPPTITTSFGPNPVGVSGVTTLTVTVSNPGSNTAAITGVGFGDGPYPGGMTNSGTAAISCSAGSTAGSATTPTTTSLASSGSTVAVGGSCTITVNLSAPAAAGNYTNTTGSVTSSNAGTGGVASATLAVGNPGIGKVFVTSPVTNTQTSVMNITLSNPTGTAMTGATVTDTLPAGMTISGTPASPQCSGTVTKAADGSWLKLTGGTVAAGGNCTVSANVAATATATNTINTGALTVTGGASNANPAAATLVVSQPPQADKTFSPVSIPTSAAASSSTLIITLSNPTSATMNGVAFTDSYPSVNLKNALASTITCTAGSSGTRTGGLGASSVGMTGGQLLGNGSCTITVSVYVTVGNAGTYTNTTSSVTSSDGGTGIAASATLTALAPFTAAKSFTPSNVFTNDDSVLTITLTNTNAVPVIGISFTDSFPAGLDFFGTPSVSTTCGGTAGYTATPNTISLANGAIPANGSCTITTTVSPTSTGNKINPVFTVSSNNAGQATSAAATLTVSAGAAPTISKSFSSGQISVSGSTTLTITLNGNGANDCASGGNVSFSDVLPANLTYSALGTPSCTNNSGNGNAVLSGTPVNTLTYTNTRLKKDALCTITATVTGSVAGTYSNIIPAVTSTSCGTGGPSNTAPLTVVLQPPTVTKAFAVKTVPANFPSSMTIILTNPAANGSDITGANFTDAFPGIAGPPAGQLVIASPLNLTNSCGGSITASAGGSSLALANGTIPAVAPRTCVVTVDVTSVTGGSYLNSTGPIYSSNAPTQSTAGTDTLTVLPLPNIVILKSAQTIWDPVNLGTNPKNIPGARVRYTIQITNFGQGTADGGSVVISDPTPANTSLYVAGSPVVSSSDGTPASGFSYPLPVTFAKPGNTNYTPVAGTNGSDPVVTSFTIRPVGSFNASNGTSNPNLSITYVVVIN